MMTCVLFAGPRVTNAPRTVIVDPHSLIPGLRREIAGIDPLAYLVTQRTKEIGIRMALGSSGGRIFKMVLSEGLTILAVGLAAGLGGAFLLRGTLEAQLFGIAATDPWILTLVVGVLALVSLVACAIPALRATRIHPVVALSE